MANKPLTIAAAVLAAATIAATHEGVKLTPYYDPPHVLTVCYGETHNVEHRKYTLDECKSMLNTQMRRTVEAVEKCVPNLPENKLVAFSDAAYNLGESVVCDPSRSTMAKLLHEGKFDAACRELPKWNKARVVTHQGRNMQPLPGLTRRRNDEMRICLGGA